MEAGLVLRLARTREPLLKYSSDADMSFFEPSQSEGLGEDASRDLMLSPPSDPMLPQPDSDEVLLRDSEGEGDS